MEKAKTTNRFSPEVRARAVRMVLEHEASTPRSGRRSARSRRRSAARRRRCEVGAPGGARQGLRAGLTSERARADQGAGAREPRAAPGERDPAQGVGVFCPGGARPPIQAMIAFIDDHREDHGVEPICRVLPIAPSTYHAHARHAAPTPPSCPARARRDAALKAGDPARLRGELRRLRRAQGLAAAAARGIDVARCTVARLMRQMGLQGACAAAGADNGQRQGGACPLDRVNRQFRAPLRMRCGCRTSPTSRPGRASSMSPSSSTPSPGASSAGGSAGQRMPTLCWTRWSRRCTTAGPASRGGLVHHSDRGVQYVSIRYTERLAEAGIEPSVGSVGDSYDNALAETINGLFKAEVIHRRGPWRNFEAVEFATSIGWIGSTIAGFSSRSASRQKPRSATTPCQRHAMAA